MNEKRIVGVNVMSEPCKFFATPESCPKGRNCFYRHSGDLERPRPAPAPVVRKTESPALEEKKDAAAAESTPSKPRVVKGWNIKKTSGSVFANDDRFPTLGSHKSEEKRQKEEEILTVCATPEFKARFPSMEESKESEAQPVETIAEEEELRDSKSEESEGEESTENAIESEGSEGSEESEGSEGSEHPEDPEDSETLPSDPEANAALTSDHNADNASDAARPAAQGSHIFTSGATLTSTVRPEDAAADDDNEWISSETLGSFDHSRISRKVVADDSIDRSRYAACCTSDFAMQNVLLQMKLQVISYDNKIITRLKSWTRRCRDCFR